jgi:hypothetical protein
MFKVPPYSLKVPSLINLFFKINSFINEMDDFEKLIIQNQFL